MASGQKTSLRREALITMLMVIAGVILALFLFAAGWLFRGRPAN